jgi:hypothetical protein
MAFPQEITQDIVRICAPLRVFLYIEKRTLSTDKLKAASFCVVIPSGSDRDALLRKLYLSIDVEIPLTFTLYTSSEWEELNDDPASYAAWIGRKGRVVYDAEA